MDQLLLNRLAVVKLLLENGADLNKADSDGKTPLFMASQLAHTAVVRLLQRWPSQVEQARQKVIKLRRRAIMIYNRGRDHGSALFKLPLTEFIIIVVKKIKIEPKTTDSLPGD